MSKPLKVLFFDQSSRLGGAEKVLLDLFENRNNQFTGTLVSPPGLLQEKARENGIRCVTLQEYEAITTTRKRIKFSDIIRGFMLIYKTEKILNNESVNIVYTNSVKCHTLVNFRNRKIPTFIRLHDYPSSFHGISRYLINRAIKNANVVSCVSQSVADEVKKLVRETNKVHVCYNGIRFENYSIKQPNHPQRPRIIIAGWLFEWKGFDLFINAMEEIAPLIPEWDFVIAGAAAYDVPESKTYEKKLINKLANSRINKRFIWYGKYASLSEVLCCAEHNIFVQPSLKPDPLPTVILEVARLNIPIIASDLGGSKEIISNYENGRLIEPTVENIKKAVLELAKDLDKRKQYGTNIAHDCEEKFSMKKYYQKTVDLLERAIFKNESQKLFNVAKDDKYENSDNN